MTMPNERTRSILQARDFLRQLRRDESLPEAIRKEANRLLRHYPLASDIDFMAERCPCMFARHPDGPEQPKGET